MLESNNLVTFEGLANSSAYHTFLLDEEKGRLVVGAKDHIFSFNLLNISKHFAQVQTFDYQTLQTRHFSTTSLQHYLALLDWTHPGSGSSQYSSM